MKKILFFAVVSIFNFQSSIAHAQCSEALKEYAARYPQAQREDLYKLVFQDLYGPGHLLTDSAAAMRYLSREVEQMSDTAYPEYMRSVDDGPFPLYEYTLCDSAFVRVNLVLVKRGVISLPELVSAVMRSSEGMVTPDSKFVMSHSAAFKAACDPHYRIVRRDIFEREFFRPIQLSLIVGPVH